MGVKIAHGSRDNINQAIAKKLIPDDSLIITRGESNELLFYDEDCGLTKLTSKNRFESFSQAQAWVKRYDCVGEIISIQNGTEWVPYIVQEHGILSPIIVGANEFLKINRIDGGKSSGTAS